jgi:prepilin-type processing-associated H-X9-DG protein
MKESIQTSEVAVASVARNRTAVENIKAHKGRLDVTIVYADGSVEVHEPSFNSRVNAGANAEANILFGATGTTSVSGAFNYIQLSSSVIAPAAGDTSLAGAISGSGLSIKQVLPSYSAPASVGSQYSVVYSTSYTATASVSVNSLGLFNNISASVLFSEVALSSTATLSSGDLLNVAYTIQS